MESRIAWQVIAAYADRRKGRTDGPFVDRTRHGAYLEIDRSTGSVRQLSRREYEQSSYPKYEDGLLPEASGESASDDDETCPDCGYAPCKSAHGIDCE